MKEKAYKLVISVIVFLILLFLTQINVYASDASITASNTNVEKGTKVTISANISSAASWELDFSATGGTITKSESRVGSTESATNENKTVTLGTFVSNNEGTYTISLSGYVVDGDTLKKVDVTGNIQIVVNNSTPTNPVTPPSTSTKSSEARLSNLGINPKEYDFSGFSKNTNKENWVAKDVPNNITEVEVYATPRDSNATVTGTGTVKLNEGENKLKVTVTAEDGVTQKTYIISVTRLTAEEDNPENETEARLKNLGIRPTEYDFSGFKRDNTSYTVEVPNELTEVEVYAEAVNPDAKITGTGKLTLQEGENTVNVEVTAPDGTTKKTYTLVITRIASTATEEPEEPTDDEEKVFGLSQLLVKGQNLSPKFSEDVYEYTIGLTEDLSSLDIEALASDENATIEIAGNENLQNGENIITILVSNAETGENATYQIIVNKNVQDEAVVGKVEWLKPSTWGLREKIIVGVIIVLVIIIIVAIVIKVRLSRRDDDDMDLPGGEELDRALSEHQEIEDEVSEAEKDISETEENVKSDAEIAQEYFESYSKRRGKHF